MTIDSSSWTGRPSAFDRDEYGVSAWDYYRWARDDRREWFRHRWQTLLALWAPPVRHQPRDSREGWTVYDGHSRGRGDDWTVWLAFLATIAIVTGRDHRQRDVDCHGYQHSFDVAYFDAYRTYGGYEVVVACLYPRCRISIFSDGECLM